MTSSSANRTTGASSCNGHQSDPAETGVHHESLAPAIADPAAEEWPVQRMTLPQEALFVAVICMAQLLTQAGYLGTLFLLRSIGGSFGINDPARLAWLVGGYSLTVGTFILFSGRLGDVFGYKRMLLIGFCWFSVWSLVAGLAVYSNFTLAVFARVLQGIGPAICLPNALAILGVSYPSGYRKAMVFALFGAVAPIGGIFGALFGGLLDLAWWPWSNWVLALALAVTCVLAIWAVPSSQQKDPLPNGFMAICRTLDAWGALTGVTSLVLFNFAWTQAPISGWNTPTVLVPLILSLMLFGFFVIYESKLAQAPLLPFDALNSDVLFVLASVACGWATFGIWTLYLVQILQNIRGLSVLHTVAWFCPVTVSGACAAVVTGKMLGPLQVRPPVVMTISLLAFTIGVTLTAFAPTHQVYWAQIFVSMLIMPFGMDMSFPAATLILSNAVSREHQGIGASLVNTCVNYGIALGVGFASTADAQLKGDQDGIATQLRGFRGGLYVGIGIAGLGLATTVVFLIKKPYLPPRVRKGVV